MSQCSFHFNYFKHLIIKKVFFKNVLKKFKDTNTNSEEQRNIMSNKTKRT